MGSATTRTTSADPATAAGATVSTETLRALDPRRALAGARTRVLLAFVVLLALSTLVSTLALAKRSSSRAPASASRRR